MNIEEIKKKNRALLENTRKKIESLETKTTGNKDERWWKLTTVENEGEAIIRFLPPKDGETDAFVIYHDYSFKGPTGKTYWEKSRRNIGESDPVAKFKSEAYASEDPDRILKAKKLSRRENYVSNILVINDKANPENNGKVFLFRYGKQVYAKIHELVFPDEDTGDKPEVPFDFWEGRNFKLKAVAKSDFPNYESSKFLAKSEIFDGDEEKIKQVNANLYSLKEFNDPDTYKSYEELEKRLFEVLEINTSSNTASRIRHAIDTETENLSEHIEDIGVGNMDDDGEDNLDALLASIHKDD